MTENFYQYQVRRFTILLTWGIGSSVVGLSAPLVKNQFWRNVLYQAFGWGAINTALALFGGCGARRKGATNPDSATTRKDAQNFRRLLLINTGLDTTYIAGGLWLSRNARSERQGMGWGIVAQGLFLLLFDSLVGYEVGARWLRD